MIDNSAAAARFLVKAYPDASWSLPDPGTYRDLRWNTPSVPKPTAEEFNAGVAAELAAHNSTEYQRQRAKAYPPVADYLDAVVKGDQAQMQAYVNACLAVKAQFPKPE
jgi:hypothetical protein